MNDASAGAHAIHLIFARRSIRVFSPGAITEEEVLTLLKAAMAAPSAMSKDPWRFVTVRDRQTLGRLKESLPGGGMLPTADMAVVVCGDLDAAFQNHASYLLQDCSAATENLLLAAQALGIGACWVGIHPLESAIQTVRGLLNLPANVVPLSAIALGRPGEQPEPRTRYNAAFVHRERW